jgi:hypothetical protein
MAYIKLDEPLGFTNHARLTEDLISIAQNGASIRPTPYSLLEVYGNNFINSTRLDYGAREYRYNEQLYHALQKNTYAFVFETVRINWFWLALCLALPGTRANSAEFAERLDLDDALASLVFSGIKKHRLVSYVDHEMRCQIAGYDQKLKNFSSDLSPLVRLIILKSPKWQKRIYWSRKFWGNSMMNKVIYRYCANKGLIPFSIEA